MHESVALNLVRSNFARLMHMIRELEQAKSRKDCFYEKQQIRDLMGRYEKDVCELVQNAVGKILKSIPYTLTEEQRKQYTEHDCGDYADIDVSIHDDCLFLRISYLVPPVMTASELILALTDFFGHSEWHAYIYTFFEVDSNFAMNRRSSKSNKTQRPA